MRKTRTKHCGPHLVRHTIAGVMVAAATLVAPMTTHAIDHGAQTEDIAALNGLHVYASSITLREAPGETASEISTLSYGSLLFPIPDDQANKNSDWTYVEAGIEQGYVPTAQLLPIPAPDITKPGIVSLTKMLQAIGAPVTKATENGSLTRQVYSHGVTHVIQEHTFEDFSYSEESLEVTGINLTQAFLIARAIVASEGPASYILSTEATIEKDEDGNPFIFDDGDWQLISITPNKGEGADGVTISFPERAD